MNKIDVVVPCYNYGMYLPECVNSVLQQSGVDVRVLVIDDSSTDDSAKIAEDLARRDSRVTLRAHKVNTGHIATFNEGIAWVEAESMLLLSADDFLLPGALKRATDIMSQYPGVGFVFGGGYELLENGSRRRYNGTRALEDEQPGNVFSGRQFLSASGARNIVLTATAVVRSALLKQTGGYRPDMPHAADMELWWRIAASFDVGFVKEAQASYRRHPRCMSKTYYANSLLEDFRQRQMLIDLFFCGEGRRVEDWQLLELVARRQLSISALRCASGALNVEDYDTANALEALALSAWSPSARSWPRQKLQIKRLLGPRVWNGLRASVRSTIGR